MNHYLHDGHCKTVKVHSALDKQRLSNAMCTPAATEPRHAHPHIYTHTHTHTHTAMQYTLMEEHTKRERERDAQPHIHTHRHKRKHTLKQIYHVRLGTNTIMSSWKSMNTQEWS